MTKKPTKPVIDEDILHSAGGMIRAYRAGAVAACKKQLAKMSSRPDPFGIEVWQRILAAVQNIQGTAVVKVSEREHTAAGPASRA